MASSLWIPPRPTTSLVLTPGHAAESRTWHAFLSTFPSRLRPFDGMPSPDIPHPRHLRASLRILPPRQYDRVLLDGYWGEEGRACIYLHLTLYPCDGHSQSGKVVMTDKSPAWVESLTAALEGAIQESGWAWSGRPVPALCHMPLCPRGEGGRGRSGEAAAGAGDSLSGLRPGPRQQLPRGHQSRWNPRCSL